MSLILFTGMFVRMGTRTVLQHVDFRIEKGALVTVVGLNGLGKSTFLRAIIGAVPFLEGHIEHLKLFRIS